MSYSHQLLAASFILATACSQEQSGFTANTGTKAQEFQQANDAAPEPKVEPKVEEQKALTIEDVCKTQTLQTLTQPINFPERRDCSFGQGDNLPIRNGFVQAYFTEKAEVSLPENAVLCGIDIKSESAELRYDDYLFFSLNDLILASSNTELSAHFDKADTVYQWNWEKLKGQSFPNLDQPYCLGSGTCVIPPTDSVGPFDLSFNAEDKSFQAVAGQALKEKSVTFSLTTTGDNDDGDCSHTDFNLSVNLSYAVISE